MILGFLYLIFINISALLAIPLLLYGFVCLFFQSKRIHGASILLTGLAAGLACFLVFWALGGIITKGEFESINSSLAYLWAGTGFTFAGYAIAFFGGVVMAIKRIFRFLKRADRLA